MSYEGYSQFLCSKNHYWTLDCNEEADNFKDNECPFCFRNAIWFNQVNTTNGSFDDDGSRIDGFIDLKVKKIKSGVCSCCGKEHICETIYQIPKRRRK